jgi:hypothetical protein
MRHESEVEWRLETGCVAGYAVNGPQWALRSGLGLGRWEEAPKATVLVRGHV